MGLFGRKKKKIDYLAKAHEIERNIWELENKQILYLDKLKGVVSKQEEYKAAAKAETDKNMQRHFASLYLNAEKEKEQYAYSINEISKEIVSNAKMAQLVDTQALFVELEKMESLSLEQIGEMSHSITNSREKRETMTTLRNEAIDKAMYHSKTQQAQSFAADDLLSKWETEAVQEQAAQEQAAQEQAEREAQEAQQSGNEPIEQEREDSEQSGAQAEQAQYSAEDEFLQQLRIEEE